MLSQSTAAGPSPSGGLSLEVIVLNWNRARLLRDTLDSLFETHPGVGRVTVIDNASTDESRQVVDEFAGSHPCLSRHYVERNAGAEPINDVWREVRSDLVLILANDKRLLPGWFDYGRAAFEAFPDLGQLALHPPVPDDDEVWVTKPSIPAVRNGVALYRALGNTGMSTILRAAVIDAGRIRFGNLEPTPEAPDLRLPADIGLSSAIQAQGYFSAWSDRSYCVNVGHTIEEFEAEWAYYAGNYQGKSNLGLEGLRRRIEAHRAMPKPRRSSRLAGWKLSPEASLKEGTPESRCWSMTDLLTPPAETLEYLHALIRVEKPRDILIVGGSSPTLIDAVALAVGDNDFGRIVVVERNPTLRDRIAAHLSAAAPGAAISLSDGPAEDTAACQLAICFGLPEFFSAHRALFSEEGFLSQARHLLMESTLFKALTEAERQGLKQRFSSFESGGPRPFRQFVRKKGA